MLTYQKLLLIKIIFYTVTVWFIMSLLIGIINVVNMHHEGINFFQLIFNTIIGILDVFLLFYTMDFLDKLSDFKFKHHYLISYRTSDIHAGHTTFLSDSKNITKDIHLDVLKYIENKHHTNVYAIISINYLGYMLDTEYL